MVVLFVFSRRNYINYFRGSWIKIVRQIYDLYTFWADITPKKLNTNRKKLKFLFLN